MTDKAISKWERGQDFPDIKAIESLADALEVSVLEIMNSEKIKQNEIETEKASEALSTMLSVAKYHKKMEWRNVLNCALTALSIMLLILLGDTMGLYGFLLVCVPVTSVIVGIVLILTYFFLTKHLTHRKMFLVFGFILIGISAIFFLIPTILLLIIYLLN